MDIEQTQSISSEIFVNYKGKNDFTVGETGRYHLNKGSWLISQVVRHIHIVYSLTGYTYRGENTLLRDCQKI